MMETAVSVKAHLGNLLLLLRLPLLLRSFIVIAECIARARVLVDRTRTVRHYYTAPH